MKEKLLFSVFLLAVILFSAGCTKKSGNSDSPFSSSKKSNFESPEEFLQNPSVQNAIQESSISINKGDDPPLLAGIYSVNGYVVDVSSAAQELYGSPISSTITLYNQTASGKIDLKEEVSGIVVYGSGGYIIGENGAFSVFQESKQNGEEAGLPSDLSVTVVLIMSGVKNSSGDLRAKGISIVTKATSTSSGKYDLEEIEKIWWMWDAQFTLKGAAPKKFVFTGGNNTYIPNEIKNIISNLILK